MGYSFHHYPLSASSTPGFMISKSDSQWYGAGKKGKTKM